MDRINDIMGKGGRHRELEVFLTTFDGEQHLRLHGWLKRNDIIVKMESINKKEDSFGTFTIYINDKMLENLKVDNLERGLYCDIDVMNGENERWGLLRSIEHSQQQENLLDKIQNFMFSFQIKSKEDISKFLKQANETSLKLFKQDKSFITDYVETKEMSKKDKLKDIEMMINAFVEEERYEDCAFLVKIKNKIKKYYNKQKINSYE